MSSGVPAPAEQKIASSSISLALQSDAVVREEDGDGERRGEGSR